ncbi:MAG: type 2 isopentenyl-diphosphate Delta-isomerase [Chloroflexi bacterium]|nr:type 2 isopentenyl-diphosphate Delta-isomerase [Chloroflexota bacterium]
MKKVTPTERRKDEHLRINLEQDVRSSLRSGFERYTFLHQALPELNLEDIDTRLTLFGRALQAPLLISAMTGGTREAARINQRLAEAAQHLGLAMGVGSQRAALENPAVASTFQVRRYAPDILLFANLGAVQLNYGYTVDHCRRAVEMIQADALVLHLNPLQEALQPEGDTRFAGLLRKIEAVARALEVPLIVKEVGWGISPQVARQLADAGVAAIDVAGAGGTSWSQVEMHRARTAFHAQVAAAFADWGIPTAESLRYVRQAAPHVLAFASGGLRTGVDVAKAIALGATLAGFAGPLLRAAAQSTEAAIEALRVLHQQLRVTMFVVGARDLDALRRTPLIRREAPQQDNAP